VNQERECTVVDKRRLGEIEYEAGSGNVFADIGVPNPEEALLKAKLAHQINRIVEQRGLSQASVATILGIAQPKVSNLNVGRLRGFSVERLMRFLTLLGNDVEIVERPVAQEHGETRGVEERF
jgi:predicted XRE-type DNA-binding protein